LSKQGRVFNDAFARASGAQTDLASVLDSGERPSLRLAELGALLWRGGVGRALVGRRGRVDR
jgi:hypothetical protein